MRRGGMRMILCKRGEGEGFLGRIHRGFCKGLLLQMRNLFSFFECLFFLRVECEQIII